MVKNDANDSLGLVEELPEEVLQEIVDNQKTLASIDMEKVVSPAVKATVTLLNGQVYYVWVYLAMPEAVRDYAVSAVVAEEIMNGITISYEGGAE